MNLGAIKRNCMARRLVVVINTPTGGQWISDGSNAWRVDGVRVDRDAIISLFNLSVQQEDKMIIKEMDAKDERFTPYEMDGEEGVAEIGAMARLDSLFIGLKSRAGVMWIPYDAVKHIKDDVRRYAVRWRNGRPMVAVYGDMFAAALVMPVANFYAEDLTNMARKLAAPAFLYADKEKAASEAEAAAEELARQMGIGDDGGGDEA